MITPYNDKEPKVDQVRKMFNRIAPTYDRLNRIISLGMDKSWRRKALRMLLPYDPKNILDVATGTGDLAIELYETIPGVRSITGIDISDEMLRQGNRKIREMGLEQTINLQKQDCTSTTFDNETFDAITVAFGIRNVEDIPAALREFYRLLKPGTPALILELSEPRNSIVKRGYKIYANLFIPWVGNLIAHDPQAYSYLPKSVEAVPQREKMVSLLRDAGFQEAFYHSYNPGICTLYLALK